LPILLNNIFGVDLDKQAVEVARLNLLIRSLSGQYHLPPLKNNIKQGNSLISGTEEELKNYFGDDWKNKNGFNWEEEFKDIMKNGGFDVVIGNPPWVSLTGKHKSLEFSEAEMKYLFENNRFNTYSPNLYEAFIWRALNLLNVNGLFSFIVPDRLASNQQFIKLREYILQNFTILNLMFRFPFPGVIADTMVFVIKKRKPQKDDIIEILDFPNHKTTKIPQNKFLASADFQLFFIDSRFAKIFNKIFGKGNVKRLDEIVKITSGCGAKSELLHDKRLTRKEIKVLKGENIVRYASKNHFWFEFIQDNLSGRTRDEDKLGVKKKVLLRKTGGDIIATFDDSGIYPEQSLYFLYDADKDTLVYLLAILNSRLINTYYQNFAVTNRNTTPQLKNVDLDQFPIVYPAPDKTRIALIALADKMLKLSKELLEISDYETDKKEKLEKEIKNIDNKIDNLVYQLYGLTPEEIAVVEGKT
jgi:hypothetical protein